MLSVGIQTHPLRHDMASALAEQVGGELCVDPEPLGLRSPWRTYRYALELTPPEATHRLILQDDVEVCRDFTQTVTAAIAAQPDRLVTFFVGGLPLEHKRSLMNACERDLSWADLDYKRWTPALALCWPVAMIRSFLDWFDREALRRGWDEKFRADDEIIGRYMRHEKQFPLASVPSLVEHPDVVESLIGRRARAGRDRARVAACMIHPDCDPLSIDWQRGP